MPVYNVAAVKEGELEMVLVPMSDDFDKQDDESREYFLDVVKAAAAKAKLKGTVIVAWIGESGKLQCLAPRDYREYLSTTTLAGIRKKCNAKLTC
jgi:hypothetical protein